LRDFQFVQNTIIAMLLLGKRAVTLIKVIQL